MTYASARLCDKERTLSRVLANTFRNSKQITILNRSAGVEKKILDSQNPIATRLAISERSITAPYRLRGHCAVKSVHRFCERRNDVAVQLFVRQKQIVRVENAIIIDRSLRPLRAECVVYKPANLSPNSAPKIVLSVARFAVCRKHRPGNFGVATVTAYLPLFRKYVWASATVLFEWRLSRGNRVTFGCG